MGLSLCGETMSCKTGLSSAGAKMETLSRTVMVIQDLDELKFVYIRLSLTHKRSSRVSARQ